MFKWGFYISDICTTFTNKESSDVSPANVSLGTALMLLSVNHLRKKLCFYKQLINTCVVCQKLCGHVGLAVLKWNVDKHEKRDKYVLELIEINNKCEVGSEPGFNEGLYLIFQQTCYRLCQDLHFSCILFWLKGLSLTVWNPACSATEKRFYVTKQWVKRLLELIGFFKYLLF